jgi:hypothetical protein
VLAVAIRRREQRRMCRRRYMAIRRASCCAATLVIAICLNTCIVFALQENGVHSSGAYKHNF